MVFIIFGFFVVSWQYLTWVGSPLPFLLLGAGVTCAAEGGSRQTAGCGSLISTPGNFIGVKGGEKHCEATEPRAGVDYLSGLGFLSRAGMQQMGFCLSLLWGSGGLW